MTTKGGDIKIELIGDEELQRCLFELNYKTQHKYLKRILNHAANVPLKAARSEVPKRKTNLERPTPTQAHPLRGQKWHPPGLGQSRKSWLKKRGRSKKTATVFVGPRWTPGRYETDTFYLWFWENVNPGAERIKGAYEQSMRDADRIITNSIRTIFTRAINKLRK